MYDNFKLWMDAHKIERGYKDSLPPLLSKPNYIEKSNGSWCITGNLENLFVSVGEAGVSIEGSPNKYWHGYNDAKLTRQEFQHTIEKLSDTFSFEVNQAKATQLDFAHNFVMKEPVQAYYPYLGMSSRFTRVLDRNSLYYRNKRKVIIFYDKLAEIQANKVPVPFAWQNKNVLRFEVRFKGRLLQLFNRQTLTAKDLANEVFYMEVVNKWVNEYLNINKNKVMTPNIDNFTSKKAKDYLLSALVDEIGQNKVMDLVNGWENKFTTKKEAQRFKNSLKDLTGLNEESELINELTNKIVDIKRYYR